MDRIGWGVLGYARIAREQVIPAIQKSSQSELRAIASQTAQRLADCRVEHPGVKVYGTYDELLADPEVQAVFIPLPNSLHKEWTIKAAERGKHVLCEKPLALDAAECREMIAACAAHRVKLMEAFMYRYTDRVRKVEEILRSGALGEIRLIRSAFHFPLRRDPDIRLVQELGGGSLYDVGSYTVNFLGLVTGSAPISVKAEAVTKNGVDLGFSAVLRYPGGVLAMLSSGFQAHARYNFGEVMGTAGLLEVPDVFLGMNGGIYLTTAEGRREIPVAESDRYLLEVEDFAAAVLEDRQPFLSVEESLRNMEIMDKLRASIQTG